jgi:hypothetical protein
MLERAGLFALLLMLAFILSVLVLRLGLVGLVRLWLGRGG